MDAVRNDNRVAILLATYNGAMFLKEQLNSLFQQTFHDWHLYIHDDGSSDETIQIIEQYVLNNPDRITLIGGEPTGGAKTNFYHLLRQVESELYMFCDQDDVWLPNKIEKTVIAWDSDGVADQPGLVFTDLRIVDQELNTIAESLWNYYKFNTIDIKMESLILQNVITGCTMLINRQMRDWMLRYKNIENVPMHDKWAAMIALQFGKLIRIEESTIMYRQHENNSVGAKKSNGMNYAVSKVNSLSKLKRSYQFTRRQAIEFCDIYAVESNEIIYKYAKIEGHGKLYRIFSYFKYGFRTNRRSQFIGLIICG